MKQRERRAATRNAIIDAAELLFADKGIEAVTIDDIVAQSQVARGSFYYNFESKEQVVLAIGQRSFARVANDGFQAGRRRFAQPAVARTIVKNVPLVRQESTSG